MDTKNVSTAALLSISTGILFCGFGEMQEAAEFLMGHPIWTHHFANKALWERMQAAIVNQHPKFPTTMPGVDATNWADALDRVEMKFGKELPIRKGDGTSAMHPLDGIPEGKQVTVIEVGK
jgi:hypothetical protein